jgi:hypothetical protein
MAIVLITVGVGSAMVPGPATRRPTTLSAEIRVHPADPSALHARINDLEFVDSSYDGRQVTGGLPYRSAGSTAMEMELWWFNLDRQQHYALTVTLDATALSTFSEDGEHASLAVEVGPGADVTVTTPNQEGLHLTGENRTGAITPGMDAPVVLGRFCGVPQQGDTSPAGKLMRVTNDQTSLAIARAAQKSYLDYHGPAMARCAGK